MMNVSSFYFRYSTSTKIENLFFSSVCVVVVERGKFSLDCSIAYLLFTYFSWGIENLVKMAMCDKIFMRIHYVIGKRMN